MSYGSELGHVEAVTTEVARETLADVEGGVSSFEPFVRYSGFGESSIDFNVILRVGEPTDRYLVVHGFVKRLHLRYACEGIEISFPIRTIVLGGNTRARADHLTDQRPSGEDTMDGRYG